jgi:diguanylate cyclase (GGDEF)-like protein
MSSSPEILFDYMSNIYFFNPQEPLDLDLLDDELRDLGEGLIHLEESLTACNKYAIDLSRGNLDADLPPVSNEISSALKTLHASLRHVTWQSKQVADGDYTQKVDFMGEFADAFNRMVDQLAERQEKLEKEIELSKIHAEEMGRGQILLSNLMHNIPQQIFVVSVEKGHAVFHNESAEAELKKDPTYLSRIFDAFPSFDDKTYYKDIEVKLTNKNDEQFLRISSYPIKWGQLDAVTLSISDISVEKKRMMSLETHAYYDELTGLYNRHYGMRVFNEWLKEKRAFVLAFIDLDSLKFINDKYGHEEGDKYISKVANYLTSALEDAIVCRVGGDEYMALKPGITYYKMKKIMAEIAKNIEDDEYLEDKDYLYSISYGVVEIKEDNILLPSVILNTADEKMYEHKKARKKERLAS